MPDKKSAPAKPAARAAKTATSKKVAPKPEARKTPAPAAKSPPKRPAKAAPKQAVKKPEPKAPIKPAGKAKAPVEIKAAARPKTPEAKAKASAKLKPAPAKPAAKKPTAPPKPAPAPKPLAAAPEKAPARPQKAAKPSPPKPVKLPPVEAAFAKPQPAKPLAVAAGRAQPVARVQAQTPARPAAKALSAPKPVEPAETVGDPQSVPAFKAKTNGSAKDMVLVGAIAGAFGVKGEVRLRAFTHRKEGIISYGPLFGEDGKVLLKPKSWRELKDGVAVLAPEVKSREQADQLRGLRLFVPRSNLPAPEADEFYIVDLLGCRAESLDGKVLGEICAVWNFGAGDIIEYRPPGGGPNVRVTFTRQTAPLVDLQGKRVVLDPPVPEAIEK